MWSFAGLPKLKTIDCNFVNATLSAATCRPKALFLELETWPKPGLVSHADSRSPKLGNHSFRATGITAYLKNGGTLEKAAQMANHASTRTTQLYDRRAEEVTLDEVEWILV